MSDAPNPTPNQSEPATGPAPEAGGPAATEASPRQPRIVDSGPLLLQGAATIGGDS